MKPLLLVALAATCLVAPYTAAETPSEMVQSQRSTFGPIVPGKSAGALQLGMSSSQVRTMLGKPSRIRPRGPGINEVVWDKPTRNENFHAIKIIFASDKAVQIGVTEPEFVAPGGVTTNTTLAQTFQIYKNLTYQVYGVDLDEGGYQANFYDSRERGIAFMIGAQDDYNHSATFDTIYIHRPGKPVMPDANSTLFGGNFSK